MVGGDAADIARVRPVLDCMGTDFFHCGELGAGQTVKLINNLLATCIAEARVEALVAGTKAGITLDTMLSVFRTTMAWSSQLAVAMPKRPLAGDFSPGFMMKLAHKDCRLALQMAEGLGVTAAGGSRGAREPRSGIWRAASPTTTSARCSRCASRTRWGSRCGCARRREMDAASSRCGGS